MNATRAGQLLATVSLLAAAAACSGLRGFPFSTGTELSFSTETGSWEITVRDMVWLEPEDGEQVREQLTELGVLSVDCCQSLTEVEVLPDLSERYLVILVEIRNTDDRRASTYEGVRHMAYNGLTGRLAEPDGVSHYVLNRNDGPFEPTVAPGDRVQDAFVFLLKPGAERFDFWIETFSMFPQPLFPLKLSADRIRGPMAPGGP